MPTDSGYVCGMQLITQKLEARTQADIIHEQKVQLRKEKAARLQFSVSAAVRIPLYAACSSVLPVSACPSLSLS